MSTSTSDIPLDAIQDEMEKLDSAFDPIPHANILERLIERIQPINFREHANLTNNEQRLRKQHFVICTIEQILELAKTNLWNLCQQQDFIYLYNGAFWKELSNRELKYFLGKAAEQMGVDKFEARFFSFQEFLYKQFLASAYLPKPESEAEKICINLQNGTFDVSQQGGKLRPFDETDFLTYQLPFAYNPEATAPQFQIYLDTVLPDKKLQFILAEYLAYLFTPHLKLEKTLLLYGTGANGKSVFFEIVNALLGKSNMTSFSLQSLTNESGYFRAKLGNTLVNYATEINGKLESSIFKQLVSGEPVEARLPYGEPFTLTQYARLIFNCNHLPREVEHSDAFFRRFLIIPFKVTIPEAQQDKKLANKIIRNELSGVFNWVLDGLKRLLENNGFTHSPETQRQVEKYRSESDSVHLFLDEEQLIASDQSWRSLRDLYTDYVGFCYQDHYRPLGKINFRKRLEAIGIVTKRRKTGMVIFIQKMSQTQQATLIAEAS